MAPRAVPAAGPKTSADAAEPIVNICQRLAWNRDSALRTQILASSNSPPQALDRHFRFGYAFPSALFHNTQRAQARFAILICSKASLTSEDLMSHAECGDLLNHIQQACESSQESGCAGRSNGPQICVFFRVLLV
jgi:hypothetical protein